MTALDRFDRELEAWLASEVRGAVPAGLHEMVMANVGRTRQRPAWLGAVRSGSMGISARTRANPRLVLVIVILGLLLALAVAAAVGALRSRSSDVPSVRNGAIAYSIDAMPSARDANDDLHMVSADGSDDRVIAHGHCPEFSEDGRTLAYLTGPRDSVAWEVAMPDGSAPRQLDVPRNARIALSPDGERVAWIGPQMIAHDVLAPEAEFGFWTMNVDGSDRRRLVPPSSDPALRYDTPVWSPDGRSIAVAVMREGDIAGPYREAIEIVDVDTGVRNRITSRPNGTYGDGISWSPDSRSIVYLGLPDGSRLPSPGPGNGLPDASPVPADLFVIGADGSGDRNLTNSALSEGQPSWSPDGTRIAYEAFVDGDSRVSVLRVDGDMPRAPFDGPAADQFTWSPDGSMLLLSRTVAFSSGVDSQGFYSTLQTIDAGLQHPPQIVFGTGYRLVCGPSWQPLKP